MSIFDFFRKNNAENKPLPADQSEQKPQPETAAPQERKSLLEIAREAQEAERLAREQEAASLAASTETAANAADFYTVLFEKTEEAGLLDSRLGGVPYWDGKQAYPCDENGKPMRLLLQLNFDTLSLHDERLPESGLLQFYLSADPLCSGKVIYHAAATDGEAPRDVPTMPSEEGFSPVRATAIAMLRHEDTEQTENGHKVFGTPAFCQADPREALDDEQAAYYDTLLLQLDSDFNGGDPLLLWGDSGVGNFFINSEALMRRDFSDVLFYWDCY